MIKDNLKNCELYLDVNDKFADAFKFLKDINQNEFTVGKKEICGDNIYASLQEYVSSVPDNNTYEAHEKYIDVQFVLSGEEKILVADINQGKKITEYDKDNDFSLYSVDSNPTVLTLSAGDFAVFYPQDLHKPCLALNEPAKIQKIVVKVKI